MKVTQILEQATQDYAVQLTARQIEQFDLYYRLLVEWNEKINLTAITDPQGVAVKHFADSLTFFNYIKNIPEGASIIDVGTGAGFPGVVIKIIRPDLQLTLLDSLNKRFLFLRELMEQLDLQATFVQGRAEAYGNDLNMRESYDFVVSRAVAQLNTLSEYCLPFVRLAGRFIAFKGGNAAEEIQNARHAVQVLGGSIKNIHSFELPMEGGSRTLVEIEKIQPTPDKYPRNNGRIKAKPL